MNALDVGPAPARHPDPAALLDVVALGIAVLDDRARPVYANAAARRSFECGDAGLGLRAGRVAPTAAHAEPGWHEALREAATGRTLTLRLDAPAGPVGVSIGPAPGDRGVVCILPLARSGRACSLRAYARAHGLTAAEARVLEAIVAGDPPKAIAQARGASENTVRAQVRAILAKTGNGSLRALAIDALRSAPVAQDER